LEAYRTLDAFPDARAALAALKARGLRLAILSNGTPSMLSAAVEAAGLAEYLDAVLSVDAVRQYKPRPEVYELVTDAFALERSGVGFVSSNRWDVMGAASFGFQTYWVNRLAVPDEYADFAPLRRIGDLTALSTA
jgi:2-haloacid dehalogenase